jgi:hypothetical protein
VAGNQERHGIVRHSIRHGTDGARSADLPGDDFVRNSLAGWDLQERLPDLDLKIRPR